MQAIKLIQGMRQSTAVIAFSSRLSVRVGSNPEASSDVCHFPIRPSPSFSRCPLFVWFDPSAPLRSSNRERQTTHGHSGSSSSGRAPASDADRHGGADRSSVSLLVVCSRVCSAVRTMSWWAHVPQGPKVRRRRSRHSALHCAQRDWERVVRRVELTLSLSCVVCVRAGSYSGSHRGTHDTAAADRRAGRQISLTHLVQLPVGSEAAAGRKTSPDPRKG